MAVKIACDSSTDLGKEFYEKHNIQVMPYTIVLGEENYLDNVNITVPEIYKYVEETKQLPKTAATNEFTFDEFFEQHKCDDGLIYFNLSSQMSCTYNNAIASSKKFNKIHIVNFAEYLLINLAWSPITAS